MVASSEGRNAERMSPVPFCTGFPAPLLARVSVPAVVWRVKVYGLVLTLPSAPYVGSIMD